MPTWDPKDPADIADYDLSWIQVLGSDTIASLDDVVIQPVTSPGLEESGSPSRSWTATTTTVVLAGGVSGTTYTINQTITTVAGHVFQRAVVLSVEDTVPPVTAQVLVTLEQAKADQRLTSTEEDNSLQMKLDQAHALVLDWVGQRRSDEGSPSWADTVASWTTMTVPPQVQAAILVMFGVLVRFRGDDLPTDSWMDGDLPPIVKAYLSRLRDPALA